MSYLDVSYPKKVGFHCSSIKPQLFRQWYPRLNTSELSSKAWCLLPWEGYEPAIKGCQILYISTSSVYDAVEIKIFSKDHEFIEFDDKTSHYILVSVICKVGSLFRQSLRS